jgi:peptidoglycan hydrolase-like protein with peptidoglycan-binding domain
MTMHLGEATITTGASGAEVKTLQQILQGQGYNVGPVDGLYGPQTQAAVQAFQKAHGLIPDGIVGPNTWAALQGTPPAPGPVPEAVAVKPSSASSFLDSLMSPKILMLGVGAVALFAMIGNRKR